MGTEQRRQNDPSNMQFCPTTDGAERRNTRKSSGLVLTSKEGIALDIIFGLLGESRFNRDFDDWGTYYKYLYVASRAPKLEAMHADVNKILAEMKAAGQAPFEICYFKVGDSHPWYEEFPSSLSLETVRKAWVKSGMRQLQIEYRRQNRQARKRSH